MTQHKPVPADTNKDRGLQPPRNPPRMPNVQPPKTK